MGQQPLLLTHCRLEPDISADVIVYGVPTVKGMDRLIDILVMLRNSWRELNDEQPFVRYDVSALLTTTQQQEGE